jgi:hypothetical protein
MILNINDNVGIYLGRLRKGNCHPSVETKANYRADLATLMERLRIDSAKTQSSNVIVR